MGVGKVLKGVGHVFVRVFDFIQKLVPDEQLIEAIRLVEAKVTAQITSAEKREWVVARLAGKFGMSESVARLITEIAFQHVKNGLDKGEKKLEEVVEKNEPSE